MPLPQEWTDLVAQVDKTTNTEKAATLLLNQIGQMLLNNPTPQMLQDLGNALVASDNPLAAAIVANSPVGPPATASAQRGR